MDAEHQEEFAALRERAFAQLRAAGQAKLRLGVFPSFSDCHAVEVAGNWRTQSGRLRGQPAEPRFSSVEWRTWRMLEDADKFRSPVERARHPRPLLDPTVSQHNAQIELGEFDRLQLGLAALRVPILPERPNFGVDGCGYELDASAGMTSVHLRWWSSVPPEWRTLMDWFTSTMSWLAARVGVPSPFASDRIDQ